jgi:hypothetical protein
MGTFYKVAKVVNAVALVGTVAVLAHIHMNNKRVMKELGDALGKATQK